MDPYRKERVSESLREELNEMISYELSDPRIGNVIVTQVHISPDFRHAHVCLALKGTVQEQAITLEALAHAKEFLRHQLGERLQIFRMPELHFEGDLPADLASKATQILKRIKRGRPKAEKNANS